ncbi:MAG: hypothetical protein K2K55_06640 [Duncaniella sp.]|nr:hypothetical protein [Duncaniella sp.]
MKLRSFLSLFVLITTAAVYAQSPSDFLEVKIEKQVKDFPLDSINLSSPLDYYLSRAQVVLSGKYKKWGEISTSMFDYTADKPDETIDDSFRDYVLNEKIELIISYRDSVATIVTRPEGADYLLLNNCWFEDGRWVNTGQTFASDMEDAREKITKRLPENLYNLPRVAVINNLPTDVEPFVEFLSNVDQSPEEFLLDMLRQHKLVINGEYHRRKVSWDMLKRLIAMPEFADVVGCVFMELPSWHQPTMDSFLAGDTLDSNKIFSIFQDEQPHGWWDRGEYEFLCDLWNINRSLPADKKIRVVLADYQVPYSLIMDKEEAKEAEDRNTHMADVIEKTIKSSSDGRNNLFLVGCAHAFKSNQSALASAAYGKENDITAGAQLAERLGDENVFTVFQHVLPGDNYGENKSPMRGGIFDRAFELNGNRPIGFRLAGSPFGNEPFDGIYEIKYKTATGTFADNFDGYLFLSPIATEPKASPLTEIFTDEFVKEMQRRAKVMGFEDLRFIWFGRRAPELTREYILECFSE